MDCSPPGSSVHGILQARILEWIAICFSRGSYWLRDWTQVSCIAGKLFTVWATREALRSWTGPENSWLYTNSQIYATAIDGASGKGPAYQCWRQGFNPWVGKIPCGRYGYPLQYSCLENPMDRGAWWATVHRGTKSRTQLKQITMHTYHQNLPRCGRAEAKGRLYPRTW